MGIPESGRAEKTVRRNFGGEKTEKQDPKVQMPLVRQRLLHVSRFQEILSLVDLWQEVYSGEKAAEPSVGQSGSEVSDVRQNIHAGQIRRGLLLQRLPTESLSSARFGNRRNQVYKMSTWKDRYDYGTGKKLESTTSVTEKVLRIW